MTELTFYADGNRYSTTSGDNEFYTLTETVKGDRTTVVLTTKRPIMLEKARRLVPYTYSKKDRILVNGYQSWTDTREYSVNENLRSLSHLPKFLVKRFHLQYYGDYTFHSYRKGQLHSYTYSYIKKPDSNALLFGSYNEENAYLVINHHTQENLIELESDVQHRHVDGSFTLFDYISVTGNFLEIQNRYFCVFDTEKKRKLSGYSSWYNDYQDIGEDKILFALSGMDGNDFDLFQIDDGYERYVGDWLDVDEKKFPYGLEHIVKKIHEKNMLAGIWLAPFVAETKSRLYREHPEYFYREGRKNLYCGTNWSGQMCLDISKPEVLDYIRKCLEHYMDMGFDFFKLDFLYAAALVNPDNRKTRAEQMRQAMVFLRQTLKDKLILGCGVPLSSAFGLVDYCRIGCDVSLSFDDSLYMRMLHRERVSTKLTLQNTIYRMPMDGHVFANDPDVYLLRDENIKLSQAQKTALVRLNHLMGSVYLTSDNIGTYSAEKKRILSQARELEDATVTDIRDRRGIITITYLLGDKKKEMRYNTRKGTLNG